MAKIYFNRIKRGDMTLEEVPSKWRGQVEKMLAAEAPPVEHLESEE